MHHPTDRITHTTAFVTPVVEHWLGTRIMVLWSFCFIIAVLEVWWFLIGGLDEFKNFFFHWPCWPQFFLMLIFNPGTINTIHLHIKSQLLTIFNDKTMDVSSWELKISLSEITSKKARIYVALECPREIWSNKPGMVECIILNFLLGYLCSTNKTKHTIYILRLSCPSLL